MASTWRALRIAVSFGVIAPGAIACAGDGEIPQVSERKNDPRSGETRAEARESNRAGAAKPMGEPLVDDPEAPTVVAPRVGATAPAETAAPEAVAAPATEARDEIATSERELPRGTVSIVGEPYPLPETPEASEEPCVCPVEPSPGTAIVEELRARRAEARYRQPQGSAVRVAGGPPEGFERPPPTADDHRPAIPGGFERPPVSTDDFGSSRSPGPDRSAAW